MNVCKICSHKLAHNNKTGYCYPCWIQQKRQATLQLWLETGNTGCGVATTLRNCIRDYIYEQQNNLCAICGTNRLWNNKPLNFILDHIDGDASNNHRDNLRLICPNCDSQLDTFKSKNKNSARSFRTE